MLARSISLDLWTLAKPVLAIVALLVILRLIAAGRLTEPGAGILFTVPVGLIVGLEYLKTGGVEA